MNRRSFIRNSALALFGFTVLPPTETYQRVWRATPVVLEYRANGIGVYEMLKQCGSSIDVLTDSEIKLNLEKFFRDTWKIRKSRKFNAELIHA